MAQEQSQIDTVYFGNPICDMTIDDTADNAIMNKYKLEKGMATLATPEQIPMYAEIWANPARVSTLGGSALNSVRAQRYAARQASNETKLVYFGCIGQDDQGKVIVDKLNEVGIEGKFAVTDQDMTGQCASVITGKERTLVANIAASKLFPTSFAAENTSYLARAKFIYTTGFFIDSNAEAVDLICKYASDNNIGMGLNMSALFVIQFHKDKLFKAIEHADFVFCNEEEGSAFAESQGLEAHNRVEAAKIVAAMPKVNKNRPRVVIITQGSEPTLVATCDRKDDPNAEVTLQQIPVEPVDKDSIVDTNGAGDSFVGGFFAALSVGKDLVTAVKEGSALAGKAIQMTGLNFE